MYTQSQWQLKHKKGSGSVDAASTEQTLRKVSLALTDAGCFTGEGLAGVWEEPLHTPLTVHSSGVVLAPVTHAPTHTPRGCIHVRVKVAF